jgi:osmotically-inducible protein OsmY
MECPAQRRCRGMSSAFLLLPFLLAFLLLFLISASTCDRTAGESAARAEQTQAAPHTTVIATTPADTPASSKDGEIRAAVVDELFRAPHVHGGTILVDCKEGVVELVGAVDNLLAKDRAVAIAEGVKGVRAVSDRLRVEPLLRADADITSDVRSALARDPAARSYHLDISTSKGTVRLAGSVQSWSERRFAERLAKGVRGVKAVNDAITVTFTTPRTDAEIEHDVEDRLSWDSLLSRDPITVKVDKGHVQLSGVVGSAAEKSDAALAGWVRGVSNVDATRLKVEWWTRDANAKAQKYPARSDAQIAAAVKDAMLYDPRVVSFNVDPQVAGGVVTLSGQVTSLKAKRAAESLARDTVGVIGVKNVLTVRPSRAVSDQQLTKQVSSALAVNPLLAPTSIDAKAVNGKVTLRGRVPTLFESAEALDVASSLEGVKTVDNQLTVSAPEVPFVWQPHVFPFGPYVDAWHFAAVAPAQSDQEIARNIERELTWNPFVEAGDVHVDVQKGKATLTGHVDSWSERAAAENNALEGGATAVDDRLQVMAQGRRG